MTSVRGTPLVVVAALVLALVGSRTAAHAEQGPAARAAPPAGSDVGRSACAAGSVRSLRSGRVAYAATVVRPLRAYRRPGRRPFARFERLNVNRVPTVFGVLAAVRGRDCRADWYRVQLPRRPNGRSEERRV